MTSTRGESRTARSSASASTETPARRRDRGPRSRRGASEASRILAAYAATRVLLLAGLAATVFANRWAVGGAAPTWSDTLDGTWGALTAWDARWMTDIAENGYFGIGDVDGEPGHWRSLAFFPLVPYLIRAVSFVTFLPGNAAGMVLSLVAGVFVAFGAAALARRMGMDSRERVIASVLATTAPMAVVMLMPYTEAVFLTLAAWGLVAIIDRRWVAAGALILVAGLARTTALGLFIVLALAVLAHDRRNPRAWAAAAVAPLGWVAYLVWASSHLEDAGGYFGAQHRGWNSAVDGGRATLRWLWLNFTQSRETGYALSAVIIVAVAATMAWAFLGWLGGRAGLGVDRWGKAWPVLLFSCLAVGQILVSDGLMHSRPRLFLSGVLVLVVFAPVIARLRAFDRAWLLAGWLLGSAWVGWYLLAPFEWAI